MLGSLLTAGAAIYSANKSASSAKKINKMQIDYNKEMLQNQHQWEVQDLEKAGLNPLLSANGGAGTAGINPQMPDYSSITTGAQHIANMLMDQKRINNETKLNDAKANNLNINSAKTAEEVPLIEPMGESQIRLNNSMTLNNSAKTATENRNQEIMLKQMELMQLEKAIKKNDIELGTTQKEKMLWEISQMMEDLDYSRQKNSLNMQNINREIDFINSKFGKSLDYIGRAWKHIEGPAKAGTNIYGIYTGAKKANSIAESIKQRKEYSPTYYNSYIYNK